MISEHVNFKHMISVAGILTWEFLVSNFRQRKFHFEKTGEEISVPYIPFELNPSEHQQEWIEHIKRMCSQDVPPATAG